MKKTSKKDALTRKKGAKSKANPFKGEDGKSMAGKEENLKGRDDNE